MVLYSYHHKNTAKVAKVFAAVLDAQIKAPQQVDQAELLQYDLLGFGSGIYGAKHHESILDFADRVPYAPQKPAFIFSTSALTGDEKLAKDHASLREKLESKGYWIVDEFQCKGFNTNSFIKFFGGINKGRPNAADLGNAEEFARKLKQTLDRSGG